MEEFPNSHNDDVYNEDDQGIEVAEVDVLKWKENNIP